MRRFTALYLRLDQTNRTSEKLAALREYFREAPAVDAAWAVYLMSGRKIGRSISSTLLRQWAAEISGHPAWLVEECYHVVGDLSETLSLIVPGGASEGAPPALHDMIERRIRPLAGQAAEAQRQFVLDTWAQLDADQRLVFHKLISANFRVGVSKQLLVRALAEVAGVAPAVVAHRLAGHWTPNASAMQRLLDANALAESDPTLPYPFMLSHALTGGVESLGPIDDWAIEWKWDGIRAQIIRRGQTVRVWSRGDELISDAFPELVNAANLLPDGTVLDGEIVAWDAGSMRPMPFAMLQRRLNRKKVELSLWPDVPVTFIAFDLLEHAGSDLRERSHAERRTLLELCVAGEVCDGKTLRLSQPIQCAAWEGAAVLIQESRGRGVEGLMLKRRDSAYHAGRPTGLWWKLKVQPYTTDAVLIAAQPGHGKRAGLLTDYTFAVWHEGALVPVAKAYSGLTDREITDVDRFVRQHTTGRFGPVRGVEPQLVFELGFEAIQRSDRHKSGIALRFPRMLRQRTDKKPQDADSLQMLRSLLAECEARG